MSLAKQLEVLAAERASSASTHIYSDESKAGYSRPFVFIRGLNYERTPVGAGRYQPRKKGLER